MTAHPPVRRVDPPPGSLIADWYPRSWLLDSYAVDMPSPPAADMRRLAMLALGDPPAWFRTLLAIRDRAMRPLGIKPSREVREGRPSEDRVDFFPILQETENEIILGEDDRHLDFRLSLLRIRADGATRIVATTAVRVHNRLGRAYIAVIRPFHHLVARRSMARLAAAGATWRGATGAGESSGRRSGAAGR